MLRSESSFNYCYHDHTSQNNDGMIVCTNCGLVLDKVFDNSLRRMYNQDEENKKLHHEIVWRNFGSRTVINTSNFQNSKTKTLYNRLSKINSSIINGFERNLSEANPKMMRVASLLNIPSYIIKDAWKIYMYCVKQRYLLGRSIEGFVIASLYASIRVNKFPRILDDILLLTDIDNRSIHKILSVIIHNVLSKFNFVYTPVKITDLIYHFGSYIHLPITLQKEAIKLYFYTIKHGINIYGKSPIGLSLAYIYLILKKNKIHIISQSKLAKIGHVTDVTIRTRTSQIKKILNKHIF